MTNDGDRLMSVQKLCTLCSSNLTPLVYLKDKTQILVCKNCANALTFPAPLNKSYDNHVFHELAAQNEKLWRSYSTEIAQFIQHNYGTTGRLLDVGCSHGLLIEETNRLGFTAEGIDPSGGTVEYCQKKGLNVRRGYLAEGIYPPNTFDVVVMSHVLEHVFEPLELLGAARSILTPQGVLCLAQTNYQGTLARWLGRYWPAWVAQEHYYHFSPAGIAWLLQKAGFEILTIETIPLGYALSFAFRSPKAIMGTALNTFQYLVSRFRIGFPFQGDQMYVLARPAS
jgi:SAM-dependent methyltransferase